MRPWGAAILIVAASCGGTIAAHDDSATFDAGADAGFVTHANDAGFAGPPPTIADAGIFTPIDTSQWRTDGTCSFKWGQYGVDTGPYLFTGTREIAFIAGTEIPYLVFGCSGSFEGTTLTFLGGTFTDPSDGGLSNPQWALLDRVVANPPPEWDGHDSYWLDDTQISKCNLTESSASFGTIGSAVSGTFACEEMAGTGHDLSAVVDGTFGTVLSARVPFDLP